MEYLIIILPIGSVILSSWFFYKGLNNQEETSWMHVVMGFVLQIAIYAWFLYSPSLGFGLMGFIQLLFAGGTSILAGFFLIGFLPKLRKLFSLVLIISPIIMYGFLDYGMRFSPNAIIEKNGEEVALALEDYFIDYGSYPNSLENLVPTYINELNPPNTYWGWLYKLEGDDYVLGYFYYADKYLYSIRIYRPTTPEWETLDINQLDRSIDPSIDPFNLGPTPTPTPRNTIE